MVFLCLSAQAIDKPRLWNVENLKIVKNEPLYENLKYWWIKQAESILKGEAVTIVKKDTILISDTHHYVSIAPYWWPNDDGVYIKKDGIANPEFEKYDSPKIDKLNQRLRSLSIAFYFTGDERFYKSFIEQLNVWFLDVNTYMYPELLYAQLIPGNNNVGRPTGLIDAYRFTTTIESIRLVHSVRMLDRAMDKAIIAWFRKLRSWILNSSYWIEIKDDNNNITTAIDVLLYDISLFVGDKKTEKAIYNSFAIKRLHRQIDDEGKQPAELKRSKALSYSVYNLSHYIDFSILAESNHQPFYEKHKKMIDSAFIYLFNFKDNREQFQYKELTDWNDIMSDLYMQLHRLKRLRPKNNNILERYLGKKCDLTMKNLLL